MWYFALGLVGVGLVGFGAGLMGSRARGWSSVAHAKSAAEELPGGSSAENLAVVATPMGDEASVVICLVDTARERLVVYLADGRRSRLKLLAVRDISADWALSDYNNDPPLPADVRSRVEALIEKERSTGSEGGEEPEGTP